MSQYMTHWGEAYSHAANKGASSHRAAHFADEYATALERAKPLTFSVEWWYKLYSREGERVYRETASGEIERVA